MIEVRVSTGIDPLYVGEAVREGIEQDWPYIFTDNEFEPLHDASKVGAALKAAGDCGGMPKLTIASAVPLRAVAHSPRWQSQQWRRQSEKRQLVGLAPEAADEADQEIATKLVARAVQIERGRLCSKFAVRERTSLPSPISTSCQGNRTALPCWQAPHVSPLLRQSLGPWRETGR
jgi:hypothetical protein